MPDFPAILDLGRVEDNIFTISFLAAGGDRASVQVDGIPVAGVPSMGAVRTALGNMSNAAVVETTSSIKTQVNQSSPFVVVFDESYSDASTKAVLVFQNDALELKSIAVPAPDESLFESDGVTIDASNALVQAAITAITTALNAGGADTYAYSKGYRSSRARRLPRPRTVKATSEPGVGANPPAEPGV